MMLGSAIPDIVSADVAVKGMHEVLGYPLYLIPFLGVAKLLGIIAILIPGYPRIKEWVYAGLFFDLTGATYSIVVNGGTAAEWGFMAIPLILGMLSYILSQKIEFICCNKLKYTPHGKVSDNHPYFRKNGDRNMYSG